MTDARHYGASIRKPPPGSNLDFEVEARKQIDEDEIEAPPAWLGKIGVEPGMTPREMGLIKRHNEHAAIFDEVFRSPFLEAFPHIASCDRVLPEVRAVMDACALGHRLAYASSVKPSPREPFASPEKRTIGAAVVMFGSTNAAVGYLNHGKRRDDPDIDRHHVRRAYKGYREALVRLPRLLIRFDLARNYDLTSTFIEIRREAANSRSLRGLHGHELVEVIDERYGFANIVYERMETLGDRGLLLQKQEFVLRDLQEETGRIFAHAGGVA